MLSQTNINLNYLLFILAALLPLHTRCLLLTAQAHSFYTHLAVNLNQNALIHFCFSLFKITTQLIIIVAHPNMKFLIEGNDKTGKQVKLTTNPDQKRGESEKLYYNILNPSNKIQCDVCKRDVSKSTKILADEADYCIGCFSNSEEFPTQYHVINKLDFPLFEHEWTGDEELLLFEGLQKHGFGNWGEIADFMATNKTREDVEEHYHNIFLNTHNFLPTVNVISKRDAQGRLIKGGKEGFGKKTTKSQNRGNSNNTIPFQRGSLTVNQAMNSNNKVGSNPAQIVGYMPKRGDFEVQYDNDAQLLLAEMEFNDDDTEEEKAMKFRLIDIYNHKLNERIKRKEFVITRKLLDLKEQIRLDKTRTREEKEIYNMMKVFARFNTAEDHQKLVQGIIKEKQIRQRIEELKEFKKKGFRTLAEVEDELENKKRKDDKNKKKQNDVYASDKNNPNKTRRMRKDLTVEKAEKRVLYLSREEQELCKRFNMTFKQYMMIKETIIRESVKQGTLERDQTSKLFKVEKSIADGIFDFLVQREDVVAKDYQMK